MIKTHSFHIPVMGIGFTIDTPIKIAQYGINSVISLVDDMLIEKIRKIYSEKYKIPYDEISDKIDDFRAKRITSYLNLVNEVTERKFNDVKDAFRNKRDEFKDFLSLLPDNSVLKKELEKFKSKYFDFENFEKHFKESFSKGSIDVNIMTKLDRENIKNGKELPIEYNDAHAALRGYANSNLTSSLVLSAGMNPRLYAYLENFDDFYPDSKGYIKKKIVLKVSDYRSALIQGKYLAKKGLWVSEYRIESGLNCGGHAFATEGYLMGPILEEFKNNKKELEKSIYEILVKALEDKNREIPEKKLQISITAQGGVGTAEEHEFLLDYYKVDSIGWGSPFLLVPEATTVDEDTIRKLEKAGEDDLYLSDISPLGVPFNNLKGNSKDLEKQQKIDLGRPGSSCPKQYVALNNEFTTQKICTASRQYQRLKINELETLDLSAEEYKKAFDKITVKSCICVGLGTSALLNNNLDTKQEGSGVAVCPGPNIAYFSKELSLKKMVDHIYGRVKVTDTERPNMFIKELYLYLDYLKTKVDESKDSLNKKQEKYLNGFTKNIREGIEYYDHLFSRFKYRFEESKNQLYHELESAKEVLDKINRQIEDLKLNPVRV